MGVASPIYRQRPWASSQILSGKGANNWPFQRRTAGTLILTKVGPRLSKALVVTPAWAPQRLPSGHWAGLGFVAPKRTPLLDALACACSLCTKEERRTLRRLAPAWHPWSSWLASWAPREVPRLDLSTSSRASLTRPCLRRFLVVRPARLGPSRGSSARADEEGPCWATP